MSYIPASKQFDPSRLILGTAQFGSHYGISNKEGVTDSIEVKNIIDTAMQNRINIIDTASGYGDSEKKIGNSNNNSLSVITKISNVPKDIDYNHLYNWIENSIENSIKNLRSEKINTLLVHNVDDLMGTRGERLFECLKEMKKDRKIDSIGYSVYSVAHVENLYNRFRPDVVQIPMSIMDNRFNSSGWTKKMRGDGVLVHARSIFLQGLLLMDTKKMPLYFSKWSKIWELWDKYLKINNLSPLSACLMYMMKQVSLDNISHFIVGINSNKNLLDIIEIINQPILGDFKTFDIKDENLLNPYLWKIQ